MVTCAPLGRRRTTPPAALGLTRMFSEPPLVETYAFAPSTVCAGLLFVPGTVPGVSSVLPGSLGLARR